MQRRFATLDVFTGRRFAGNPLAVVLDAGGLDTAAMQAIAREFNHPETVFVLPPEDKAHRARLRIFTPARELPFAGHPTVGTAVLLALQDRSPSGSEIVLEENIGPVRCVLEAGEGGPRPRALRHPATAGRGRGRTRRCGDRRRAASRAADIGFDRHRPSRWSAGNAFTFVPVAGLAAMARARPDAATFDAAFGSAGVVAAAFLYCAESAEPGHDFHARMFAPGMGLIEDPATGSAAAAFAGVLARLVPPGDGEHAFAIEQGYEMGRPSLIHLAITLRDGKLAAALIGGDAVVVTQGTIEA